MNQQKVETTCRDMTSYNCTDIPWTERVNVPVQKTRVVPQTRTKCQNIRVPVRVYHIKILEYYYQRECITKNLADTYVCCSNVTTYHIGDPNSWKCSFYSCRQYHSSPYFIDFHFINCFYFSGPGRDQTNSHHPNCVQGTVLQHALNSLLNRSSLWTTAAATKMPIQPGTYCYLYILVAWTGKGSALFHSLR